MTDDQAVPLPPGAERKKDTLVHDFPTDLGRGISGFAAWLAVAPAGAAAVLCAQGAAGERERWTARVDAVTVNLTRPRFTAPGQVTEAWIPLSALADLLDGTP